MAPISHRCELLNHTCLYVARVTVTSYDYEIASELVLLSPHYFLCTLLKGSSDLVLKCMHVVALNQIASEQKRVFYMILIFSLSIFIK